MAGAEAPDHTTVTEKRGGSVGVGGRDAAISQHAPRPREGGVSRVAAPPPRPHAHTLCPPIGRHVTSRPPIGRRLLARGRSPLFSSVGPKLRLFRSGRVRRQQQQRRDARCDGEGREPAGVRAGLGRLPQEVGEAEGSRVGGHGETGQAQGAGAVRRELVLHARGLHRPAPLPAGGRGGGLHGQGVRGAAAARRAAQPLQPRLRQRGPACAAGARGAQDGGEGPGRRAQADPPGAAGPGQDRRAGGRCQQEALRSWNKRAPPPSGWCGLCEGTAPKRGEMAPKYYRGGVPRLVGNGPKVYRGRGYPKMVGKCPKNIKGGILK